MLEWLNELGAYEQSLFMFDQEFMHDVTKGLAYTAPITADYSTITVTKKREKIDTIQKIALERSHLTLSQLRALQYLKQSKEVYIWLKKDGTSRVRVVVLPEITSFFNSHKLYDFSLTIELPDNFDFYKAKEY